ncbi:MAG: acyl-CoA dehydrogenase family protein [Vicinamibacteria bacterium]
MNFSLTDEQRALRDMARSLLAAHNPPARLRELWEGAARKPDVWNALADVGLTGLLVAAEHGGAGGDAVDAVVVLHEAGRACLPEPLLDTMAVAAPVLAAAGRDAATTWLPAIASGEATIAVQLADQPFAVDADVADALLVEVDGALHLVERDGFRAIPVLSEDRSRRLFRTEFEAGRRVGDAALARRWGALGTAALLNGVADALLAMTLDYVKVREQFGVAVGSFQAVKHKLATVFASLESATAATQLAAYAVATGAAGSDRAVSVAKVHAVAAESLANAEALQCHGGIGFTWEHDLHFWLKRGRALEHGYGTAGEHRRRIAAALLDAPTAKA